MCTRFHLGSSFSWEVSESCNYVNPLRDADSRKTLIVVLTRNALIQKTIEHAGNSQQLHFCGLLPNTPTHFGPMAAPKHFAPFISTVLVAHLQTHLVHVQISIFNYGQRSARTGSCIWVQTNQTFFTITCGDKSPKD